MLFRFDTALTVDWAFKINQSIVIVKDALENTRNQCAIWTSSLAGDSDLMMIVIRMLNSRNDVFPAITKL